MRFFGTVSISHLNVQGDQPKTVRSSRKKSVQPALSGQFQQTGGVAATETPLAASRSEAYQFSGSDSDVADGKKHG